MSFVKTRFFRSVALCLVFSFFFVTLIPQNSHAYIAAAEELSSTRQVDEATVQRILESKAISERLESFGLTAEEVESKINRLSDSELHSFASNLESVSPGQGGAGVIIAALVIIILVYALLQMSGHRIIVEPID
ncbi:hypothetical protein MNBD_DELTA01-1095 [hydrothermal vent metagenome]|uniref:PA2779 family protein n=1 Tax=hydrothermal vent metagenome TaxID=652676 RepID=A0A3B0R5U7_9ZZZZ